MNEFRRAKRRRAAEPIAIEDTMTEQVIGKIGNLSETGMLALADLPLTEDALYQVRFRLPDGQGGSRAIEVGAHQLWSEPANVAGHFWVGFRFIATSSADAEHLRNWVEGAAAEYV
jgi:hypothetical protein